MQPPNPPICLSKEISSAVESTHESDASYISIPNCATSRSSTPGSALSPFTLLDASTVLPGENKYSYHKILPNQLRYCWCAKEMWMTNSIAEFKSFNEDDLANKRRPYQALSYAWGESDNKHEIFLSDLTCTETEPSQIICSIPRRVYVQPNLFKALSEFDL
jgi:hypothetical protein